MLFTQSHSEVLLSGRSRLGSPRTSVCRPRSGLPYPNCPWGKRRVGVDSLRRCSATFFLAPVFWRSDINTPSIFCDS